MKQNPIASKSCYLRSLGQTAVNDPNDVETHHFYHGKQTGHLLCRAGEPVSTFFQITASTSQMSRMMGLDSTPFQVNCYPNVRLSWPCLYSLISLTILSH